MLLRAAVVELNPLHEADGRSQFHGLCWHRCIPTDVFMLIVHELSSIPQFVSHLVFLTAFPRDERSPVSTIVLAVIKSPVPTFSGEESSIDWIRFACWVAKGQQRKKDTVATNQKTGDEYKPDGFGHCWTISDERVKFCNSGNLLWLPF